MWFFDVQLPEKSCFELVKYYYAWKKSLSKVDDVSLRQTVVGEVRCVFCVFCCPAVFDSPCVSVGVVVYQSKTVLVSAKSFMPIFNYAGRDL